MNVESLAKELILKNMTEDQQMAVLDSIRQSVSQAKEVQKRKIGENVDLVVQALKKIESDIRSRFDDVGNTIEKRVSTIKDGRDGQNGSDGRDGKDGKTGRDGATGPRGADGLNGKDGRDGEDGVSVTEAHIDFDGSLIISLSNGRVINVGEVVAQDLAEKIKVISNGGGTSQSVIDTLASLQAQITAISGFVTYEGTWNASTNTPALASSVGTKGEYYVVSTTGTTNLNGITAWTQGDWAIFNGSVWEKVDNTDLVTSVAGRTGAITLTTADVSGLGTIATQAANNVSITGGSITGITDLAVADGGTGASTAPNARINLGLVIGTDVLAPTGSAASLTSFPTFNQNTTGSAATLTTGRTIAITGDLGYTSPSFDGSGNVTAAGTLATVNTDVGSFTNASITVNGKGLITAASSGTALVTAVTGTSPVVSSGGTAPAISLATAYGDTLNPYASKTANFVLAAPNGSAGVPTFRAIVAADIPTLNQNTTGTASNVTGTVAIANGGTGETTRQAAMDALAGAVTSGSYLRGNGTNVVMNTIQVADVPTLNQNTTGTAASTPKLLTTNFTIEESGGKLLFKYGATTIASMSSTGVITSATNIVSNGTP